MILFHIFYVLFVGMLVICITYNVTVEPNSYPQKYPFFIFMARIVNWCFICFTKLWISSYCLCYSDKLKSSPLLEISIFLNSHSKNYYWYMARTLTNPTTPAPDVPIYLSDPSFLPEKKLDPRIKTLPVIQGYVFSVLRFLQDTISLDTSLHAINNNLVHDYCILHRWSFVLHRCLMILQKKKAVSFVLSLSVLYFSMF